ncbi:MAG: HEAT repeat domain-containing protein [Pirellulaceae bacterium]
MNLHFSCLLESLQAPAQLDAKQMDHFVRCCEVVDQLATSDVAALLEAARRHCSLSGGPQEAMLEPLLERLVARQNQKPEPLSHEIRDRIVSLYGLLGPTSRCRGRLLQWLAMSCHDADLQALVECIISAPPEDPRAAALALTPLFQGRDYKPAVLFPRLFAALQNLSIAAPILDLSNYVTREGLVEQHPAAERGGGLATLLGHLAERLGCIEENPAAAGESPETLNQKIDECVSLVVALCDSLALIGETSAVGKLYQALDLQHRRIRTEAAAALAKLGEPKGVDALVQLAAEPVARLRVISHAQELGLADKIQDAYRTETAQAEAQVAVELAQPAFFGIPPTSLDLFDSRTQFWPGFDSPVPCYLFRYEYRFPNAPYHNVAIAGPLVHAFVADLTDLPPEDIYAAYAGWHVEDESVFEVPADHFTAEQLTEAERLELQLRNAQYDAIEPIRLGYFFGERALIAKAMHDGVTGIAVADQNGIDWFPATTQQHPIGAEEAFCIYKGRRLLRLFNG